jgi:signal transduction histidine kinase
MVVHDVSAYLSNAQYAAFLLGTGNLEHKQTQDVASLLGKDLDRLNQLVTILRDQLGHQPSLPSGKQEAFNLGEAFDEAISLLKIRRTMSIPCLFVASKAASCLMVRMKRDEMIQIIENLADNASRAASQGNCKQLVFLMDVDPVESARDARVTLSFSDNGPGISPEIMDKILSGESSGDEAPKARKARKSVGLKLISNYLEIFGGRLHYQTPAAGPMVSRQKAEEAWGELPGTTILLDLPASMIANLSDERVAQSESRKKIA